MPVGEGKVPGVTGPDKGEQAMKAVAVVDLGSPARMIDIETPLPGANEIRVQLRAAGVNPYDGKNASGAYGTLVLPFVPGVDGAGVVEMVGEGSSIFAVGERVFGRLGGSGRGTYAEYVVAPESGVIARIPEGLDFEVAAAIPVAGLTAFGVLRELALPPGARVLVVGATGGVGTFFVQLAARAGLKVTATARPEFAERTRGLGATAIIDHSSSIALPDQLRNAGVAELDALVDLVGDRQLVNSLSALVLPGGKVISTVGGVDPEGLAARQISGSNFRGRPTVAMLEELGALVGSGEIIVPIDRELNLAEAPLALEESRSGHLHGKTVIRMDSPDQRAAG